MVDATGGRNRRIVLYGNPVLRQPAARVASITPKTKQLVADLITTMLQQDGLGLAANQIGEPVAIIAINPRAAGLDHDPCCIINPQVTFTRGRLEAEEGCLSFPGLYEVVARPRLVVVEGTDVEGETTRLSGEGLMARVLAHEVDHLRGILFIDHLGSSRRQLLLDRLNEFKKRELLACR
ncbi:MAG: peptide deformylase [candidate division WOR-3 bacterium]